MSGVNKEKLAPILNRMLTTLEQKVKPEHTALVIVDVQNDFCAKGGVFDKEGHDVSAALEMIPRLSRFIDQARKAGIFIIYIQTIYTSDDAAYLSDVWLEQQSRKGKKRFVEYPGLEKGAWGSELCEGLKPIPGEVIVNKHRYNAFTDTNLNLVLRSRGIRTILVGGVATNVCVESTAREGFMRDFYVVYLKDCAATFSQEDHEKSLRTIDAHYGVVVDSVEVVKCWKIK